MTFSVIKSTSYVEYLLSYIPFIYNCTWPYTGTSNVIRYTFINPLHVHACLIIVSFSLVPCPWMCLLVAYHAVCVSDQVSTTTWHYGLLINAIKLPDMTGRFPAINSVWCLPKVNTQAFTFSYNMWETCMNKSSISVSLSSTSINVITSYRSWYEVVTSP